MKNKPASLLVVPLGFGNGRDFPIVRVMVKWRVTTERARYSDFLCLEDIQTRLDANKKIAKIANGGCYVKSSAVSKYA